MSKVNSTLEGSSCTLFTQISHRFQHPNLYSYLSALDAAQDAPHWQGRPWGHGAHGQRINAHTLAPRVSWIPYHWAKVPGFLVPRFVYLCPLRAKILLNVCVCLYIYFRQGWDMRLGLARNAEHGIPQDLPKICIWDAWTCIWDVWTCIVVSGLVLLCLDTKGSMHAPCL